MKTLMAEQRCAAQSGQLICDREAGHQGNHRGYNAQIDEPMFWPFTVNEHAGGSLNGPSRLGASPTTDTGGECVLVLVPLHIIVRMRELISVTKLGLHGTPWAHRELQALAKDLEASVIVGTDLEGRAGKPPLADRQDCLSATSNHIEASKVVSEQEGTIVEALLSAERFIRIALESHGSVFANDDYEAGLAALPRITRAYDALHQRRGA
jgi:hypothetical protein